MFFGFVTACLFAGSPTTLSPSLKDITEGVVLLPSELTIMVGDPPSTTETQEFVVPKSIPITFAILTYFYLFFIINTFH